MVRFSRPLGGGHRFIAAVEIVRRVKSEVGVGVGVVCTDCVLSVSTRSTGASLIGQTVSLTCTLQNYLPLAL